MINANLSAASARLNHAIRTLDEHWEATAATWDDSVRRDFEERFLVPLRTAVKSAIDGSREMGEVLGKIRRDCSDREEAW